ncbi:rhodanese-related sulfurtransferase [Streptomyces nitrosporeus]|uniref:Rhodanese-related sulfurtransferase n=2 Tax=Streptomyces nitrosporeus TaxID=28894 RepID=A0A5J6FNH4_9ACTN|nr:Imm53 family immunity protein [Streptomyces nitrosporeus]QEU76794.1 rhodanese-related sulfurtransferase [Streptomyces nitrosporeus]GGY90672.1 hypothetical protein GCM10010327_21730 [Streptomyces nitrosporeus]
MRVCSKTGRSPSGVPDKDRGIQFIQSWYASNCNGEWEHEFGVRMATSDNPGWHIEIDVTETDLEGVHVAREKHELLEGRWMIAWSDGVVFQLACDPLSLCCVDVFFEEVAGKAAACAGDTLA